MLSPKSLIFVSMILLTNNTKSTSVIGKLVSLDGTNPSAFVYTIPNSSKAVGICMESVGYRQKCKIATIGDTAKVLIQGFAVKDAIIRCSKSGDNVSLGTCVVSKPSDAPFLKVGTALESGSGLISTVLELTFAGDSNGAGYVPYTGATKDVDLGIHEIFTGGGQFGNATDYVNIDANGMMTLEGDATVWDDMRIIPNVFDVPGGTDPGIINYQPAGSGTIFKVYAFAKGDEGFFTVQLPHSYKAGTDLKPHVHWTPGPRGVAESGNIVQWRLDYSVAAIGSNFPASQTLSFADACDGVNNKHQMTAEATISGVGLGESSQMWGRIYRWNDVSDTWVGTGNDLPIFIEFDVHIQCNKLGTDIT